MHRTREFLFALSLFILCLLVAGMTGQAGASAPVTKTPPVITDPYHRLSGVVVYPPSRMNAESGKAADGSVSSLITELIQDPKSSVGKWLVPPVFGPNVDASLNQAANQNETTVAIDPDNNQRVIASANDYRSNLLPFVYLSTNGGTNWTNYQVPGTGALFYGDPAMAYDRGGYAYFSFLGYTAVCTPNGGMYVTRSTDSGATFSPPIQLAPNTGGGLYTMFQDKEYIAVDTNPASPYSGTVYVGWTKFIFVGGTNCTQQAEAPVVLSRSTDHGVTWSVPITASQPYSNNNQGTVPVVGLNGDVYLYYVGAATQTQLNYDSLLFSRSTDGGQTFPIFKRVADIVDLPSPLPPTNFRNNPFGAMAADKQVSGYLYAVWADYRTGDADILMVKSTDSGDTWSAPQRVNDDPASNGKDQFFPWITASTDGSIHVGWFDRREDATNRSYKEYYTVSYDHGLTWEPNIAVSTAASNPGSSGFIGDYSGLAAVDGVVIPTWTDIRAGSNQNAYIARGVYSAGPTVTPAPTSTSTATTAPPTATATSTSAVTATNTSTATSIPSPSPTACTIEFTDVLPGSTFYDNVRCLACRGIINGYTTGCEMGNPCFRPNNNVTRGQLSKIVSNAAGFSDPASGQQFEDVLPGSTFYDFVWRLAVRNYVSGYVCGGPGEPCVGPGNLPYFRPNADVTRGQMTKIVSNAAGLVDPASGQQFEDVLPGSTFYDFIYRLATRNIMSGYVCGGPGEPCVGPGNLPYFRPSSSATRGQTSKIVANTFYPGCSTPAR